ncbi:uncharacterized protein [Littorina saxatilis]|uniref:Extracellular protein n=1 Tax=Littorina saxatilis TaxID=31220 RepID=A0AAN9BVX1_9CAEN
MAASSSLWVFALCMVIALASAACPDATFSVEHSSACCDNSLNTGVLFGDILCCITPDRTQCYCKSGGNVVGEGCYAGAPTATTTTTIAPPIPPTTDAAQSTTDTAVTTPDTAVTTPDAAGTTTDETETTTDAAATSTGVASASTGAATTTSGPAAAAPVCQCYCDSAPASTSTTQCGPTAPTKLCPEVPMVRGRVLGGNPVDECTVDGVLQFSFNDRQLCNGVFVYDTKGPFVQEPVVYLPTFCRKALDQISIMVPSAQIDGTYNVITFNISNTTIIDEAAVTDNITALLTIPGILEEGSCQKPVCAFNNNTMGSEIDFNNCHITSFGSDNFTMTGTLNSGSLNKVAVAKGTNCTRAGWPGLDCFVPVDPDVYSCSGDAGAPVYCPLTTGETVLFGLVATSSTCGIEPFFNVLPIQP